MAARRKAWVETFQPDIATMLERQVFIDETSLKANLVKTTGWAPVGVRLIDMPPSATGTPKPLSRDWAATAWSHLGFWTVR